MRLSKSFGPSSTLVASLFCVVACQVGCGGGGGGSGGVGDDTGLGGDAIGDSLSGGDSTGGGDSADTGLHLDAGGDGAGGDGASDSGKTDGGGDSTVTDGGGDTKGDAATDTSVGDGKVDSGPSDTGAADTGHADTGSPDTGKPDTGPPPCGAGSCSVDTDKDGIPDSIEGSCLTPPVDTDGDGTPDYLDLDSDDDTIPDKIEWAGGGCDPTAPLNDANGDGIPNFRDLDSDGNGLPDKFEACPPASLAPTCTAAAPADTDGDGVVDFLDSENDHDSRSADPTIGLEDRFELVDDSGKYQGPRVLVPFKTYDTSVALLDTDGDGLPDVWDRDADGDNLFDLDDGLGDPNKNGAPNFRDTDSDGDGVRDVCEARANPDFTLSYAEAAKPTLDTNGDGIADYLQRDTDGDYLLDGTGALGAPTGEDKNGNCVVDADETDRLKPDTDGDGVSDFIEVTLVDVACAKDPACTPASKGKFYFLEPYSPDGSAKPTPTTSPLALSTQLNKGDVGFIVDTTGSMGGEINNLKSSLSSSIIPALKAKIPSLGVGVAAHDDFPYCVSGGGWLGGGCSDGYGSSGDLPFYLAPGGTVTTDTPTAQAAANSLVTHNGFDLPESQVPAMYAALTGSALSWPAGASGSAAGTVGPWSPPAGTFGALQFRSDALPIIVEITDAPMHDGRSIAAGGIQSPYAFSTFNADDLVGQFVALGARFIGVSADNGGRAGGGPGGDPYNYQAYIADNTSSNVPPDAFGGACGAGSCCTGVGGAGIAPDGPGGLCRSVYSINTDGTGLGGSIVDGVYAVLASIKFDVYVQAYNDAAAPLDVVGDFMQKVEPDPAGGTDPVTGGVCVTFPAAERDDRWTGPKAVIAGADGVFDTIKLVNPGNLYCFDVVPKPNTVVAPTSGAQVFTAWLRVLAQKPTGGTFTLGSDRQVLFIVPPIVN